MVGLQVFNQIVNMRLLNKDQSNEVYVLIGALSFATLLYLIVSAYHLVAALRARFALVAAAAHAVLYAVVAVYAVAVIYNHFYISLTPPVPLFLTADLLGTALFAAIAALAFSSPLVKQRDYDALQPDDPDDDPAFERRRTSIEMAPARHDAPSPPHPLAPEGVEPIAL